MKKTDSRDGVRSSRAAPAPAGRAAADAAIRAHLARRGLRRSGTREVVVDVFLEAREHASVEELTALVRKRDAGIGQATVYRTLKLLEECGVAEARRFGDGVTRYEPVVARPHHDHLICTGCGVIVEFENPDIERLQLAVAQRHGFDTESHRLELYGRCPGCRDAPRARSGRA